MNRRILLYLATAFIPALARGQVVTSWERDASGVVTSVEEGAIKEGDYAASGIVSDWNETLGDFEAHKAELESLEQEISAIVKRDHAGRINPFHTRDGRILNLPYVPGENGENLYLLTEEGITIHSAIDAPAYLQDTDPETVRWVRYYAYRARKRTAAMFRRYAEWEPRIKAYFRSQGIPEEIAELCLVESGCTYTAVSPVGAVGMWQFMPETARSMGLAVNQAADERTDPVKSTLAAAKLLLKNHRRTSDWTTAIAAYNCGTGHFTRKGREGLTWEQVKGKLPKETQQYIPCLNAIHYVWTYRNELGFE